jgi:DNA-binding CsgD family transcriptional regulator
MSERVFPPAPSIARHSAKLRARILFLLLEGKSQRELARRLMISVGTVRISRRPPPHGRRVQLIRFERAAFHQVVVQVSQRTTSRATVL